MKKTYINPQTNIVKIAMHALLNNSIDMGGSKGTFDSSSGTKLSREGRSNSSWDDEE